MSQNDSDYPDGPARESLERRLDAVERALADDKPLERADRLNDLEARVAELEAADDALGLTDVCTFYDLRDELDET